MEIKSGQILYPAGKEYPDRFNEGKFRQNLKVKMEDGTEESIWFATGKLPHSQLKKGEPVQIIFEEREGKPIRHLVVSTGLNNGQKQTQGTNTLTDEKKRQIASYITEMAKLYNYCYKATEQNVEGDELTPEDVRTIATSLFISAQRKFNL